MSVAVTSATSDSSDSSVDAIDSVDQGERRSDSVVNQCFVCLSLALLVCASSYWVVRGLMFISCVRITGMYTHYID